MSMIVGRPTRALHSLAVIALAVLLSAGHGIVNASENKSSAFSDRLIKAGLERVGKTLIYDPAYRQLSYPGGNVPDDRGVCTDVVIRAYRALGIDLQQLVHEDMRVAFSQYPKRWSLRRPDRNIDHRRVPNLRRFLVRHGKVLSVSLQAKDYKAGDLVTWDITSPVDKTRQTSGRKSPRLTFARKPHIGIVTDRLSSDGERPLIVHNIGIGARLDDILFRFQITGRYRFEG